MPHYIEEVHEMHLIIIQLQRQSPLIFGQFPSFNNSSPIRVFHWTTTQLHLHQCIPWFKFWSTYVITLYKVLFGRSKCTYSCAYQAKVVVSVESNVQSWNCWSCWNLEVFARVPNWSPTIFLFANCNHYILWHEIFGETFTMIVGKCPPHWKKLKN